MYTRAIGGVTVAQWIAAMLANDAAWTDRLEPAGTPPVRAAP
jgi:hypothetical protein